MKIRFLSEKVALIFRWNQWEYSIDEDCNWFFKII